MKVVTFAEDDTQAKTRFALLYQGFMCANPGSRPLHVQRAEMRIAEKLEAISRPVGDPLPSGFQMRELREPCVLHLDADEIAIVIQYVPTAGFPVFMNRQVLELIARLEAAPST